MKEMKQYVEGCDQCQRMKNRIEIPAGNLRLNIVLKRQWQHTSVDLITKLSVSRGHDSVLIVCNSVG